MTIMASLRQMGHGWPRRRCRSGRTRSNGRKGTNASLLPQSVDFSSRRWHIIFVDGGEGGSLPWSLLGHIMKGGSPAFLSSVCAAVATTVAFVDGSTMAIIIIAVVLVNVRYADAAIGALAQQSSLRRQSHCRTQCASPCASGGPVARGSPRERAWLDDDEMPEVEHEQLEEREQAVLVDTLRPSPECLVSCEGASESLTTPLIVSRHEEEVASDVPRATDRRRNSGHSNGT